MSKRMIAQKAYVEFSDGFGMRLCFETHHGTEKCFLTNREAMELVGEINNRLRKGGQK